MTNMSHMFSNCNNLDDLKMEYFLTDNVQYMDYLLYNCSNLQYIDFSSFNTGELENYTNIFEGLPDNGTFIYNKEKFNNTILSELPSEWEQKPINNGR